MYGQRSGAAGEALRDLQRAYPVAMGLLDEAYAAGLARRPLRTFGGRLIRLDSALAPEAGQAVGEGWDAARGRFARNAIIQGAAAELFKAWAATVRHLVRPLGGQIVLCLHDELLVHVPEGHSAVAVEVVHRALADSARGGGRGDQRRADAAHRCGAGELHWRRWNAGGAALPQRGEPWGVGADGAGGECQQGGAAGFR